MTPTPKTALTERDRQNALELIMADMLDWYLQESGGAVPTDLCEDKKAYGKILRWFEPPIPGQVNPVLVEEFLGDSWSLTLRPMEPKITNLHPR